jgi:ligand-binding SRPBCC domain-containing protein
MMKTEWDLEFSSRLRAAPDAVWRAVSTMRGVNEELRPWMRMTFPAEAAARDLATAPTGQVLFKSWLLLFGFLPMDLHSLSLTRVEPGKGFLEESTSWTNAYWRHERSLEATGEGGCVVIDRLRLRPRLRFAGPLIAWFVRTLFTNRHRRLRAKFGEA